MQYKNEDREKPQLGTRIQYRNAQNIRTEGIVLFPAKDTDYVLVRTHEKVELDIVHKTDVIA